MKTLKDFKNEFRTMSNDTREDAIEAWFEMAAQTKFRGLAIPEEWLYESKTNDDREDDSYFHQDFNEISDGLLVEIGKFLTRYCQFVQHCINNQ